MSRYLFKVCHWVKYSQKNAFFEVDSKSSDTYRAPKIGVTRRHIRHPKKNHQILKLSKHSHVIYHLNQNFMQIKKNIISRSDNNMVRHQINIFVLSECRKISKNCGILTKNGKKSKKNESQTDI